jgi:hypothetical protein
MGKVLAGATFGEDSKAVAATAPRVIQKLGQARGRVEDAKIQARLDREWHLPLLHRIYM